MSRNYNLYLQDIVEAADRIASYVEGMTRSAFEADQMRIDAVIRNLQKREKRVISFHSRTGHIFDNFFRLY